MNRNIIVFSSVDQAKEILQEFSNGFNYPSNDYKKDNLIKYSVQSSVYRALPGSVKPSIIYRGWLNNKFEKYISDIQMIKDQSEYTKLVFHYTNSLIDYWNVKSNNSNNKIGYGPASKIINLLGKMINESKYYKTENICCLLHVPFDEYSLKPLCNIINDLTNVSYKITIPNSPSMKYIINKEHYNEIQSAVMKLCKISDIDSIIYDYWSWNDTH